MAYHNLLSKNDRALAAFLISRGAGTASNTHPAKRSGDKELPLLVSYSESSEEVGRGCGTHIIKASIIAKTDGNPSETMTEDESRATSDSFAAAAFDCFYPSPIDTEGDPERVLGEQITAAGRDLAVTAPATDSDMAYYTCQACRVVGVEASFDEEGAWIDTLNLEMVCCPEAIN